MAMIEDPIVEEVRRARDEYAREHDYDLDAIFRDLKDKEKRSGRPHVAPSPKRLPMPEAG